MKIQSITFDHQVGYNAVQNNDQLKKMKWHTWHVDSIEEFNKLIKRDNTGIILLQNDKNLNNLNFQKVNPKIFPSIKLLNKYFTLGPSTPIIINAANEVLVDLFLKGKIKFLDIVKIINKILRGKNFKKYAKIKPKSLKDIKKADNWARLKTINMCVR